MSEFKSERREKKRKKQRFGHVKGGYFNDRDEVSKSMKKALRDKRKREK